MLSTTCMSLLAALTSISSVSASMPPGLPSNILVPLSLEAISETISYNFEPDVASFDRWPDVQCPQYYFKVPGERLKDALSRINPESVKKAPGGMEETGYGIVDKGQWSFLVHYKRYKTWNLKHWHYIQLGVFSVVRQFSPLRIYLTI